MLDWEEDEIIAVISYAFCVGVFYLSVKNKQKLPYKSIFVENARMQISTIIAKIIATANFSLAK